MEKQCEGRVALVTGSSGGISRSTALTLAREGADVVVNYRSTKTAAEEVVAQVRQMSRQAIKVGADVSKADQVKRLFETIEKEFGRLVILINNAGTAADQDIFQTREEDWDFMLDNNLKSCFLCCKAAMAIMAKQKSGRIVNISSIVAQRGALYGHVHYAATKNGMLGITKSLARTAAPLGINVNAIAPGHIETELASQVIGKDRLAELVAAIPLGLGKPRDIGLVAAFLCGEGGRYITGATIDVNGGIWFR